MESTSRATVAGAFVVIMLMMLIGVLSWFSTTKKTDRIEYDIFTSISINGLVPQANVELHGINVGTVESVAFVPNQPGTIQIRMMVDRSAPISQATYAMLNSRGVTGTTFVDLITDVSAPPEQQQQLLASSASSGVPQISLRPNTLQSVTENISDILQQINETLAQLNSWLSPENRQILFTTVENAGNAANEIAKLAQTLDTKADLVLSNVSTAANNISTLLESSNQLVKSLNAPDGSIQKINETLQSLSTSIHHINRLTLPQMDRSFRSIDKTAGSVNELINNLNEQPQSLFLGPAQIKAGPGEPGFEAPKKSSLSQDH